MNQRERGPLGGTCFCGRVLQNRHEMATYFWAMVPEREEGLGSRGAGRMLGRPGEAGRWLHTWALPPRARRVAAALAACKALKEMSHPWRRRPRWAGL